LREDVDGEKALQLSVAVVAGHVVFTECLKIHVMSIDFNAIIVTLVGLQFPLLTATPLGIRKQLLSMVTFDVNITASLFWLLAS